MSDLSKSSAKQMQKMLRLRGKAVDEEHKDSGEEQRDEDEGLGPRSNISLLDQHQHLKEKAEGVCSICPFFLKPYSSLSFCRNLQAFWFLCLQHVKSQQRRNSSKRKKRFLRVLQRDEVIEFFKDDLNNMYQSFYLAQ